VQTTHNNQIKKEAVLRDYFYYLGRYVLRSCFE
jgi:hypothetical protein